MIIETQWIYGSYKKLINLDKVCCLEVEAIGKERKKFSFYADEQQLGVYCGSARAQEVFNKIKQALIEGRECFEMPEED